jgi:hypothetical protein
MVFADFSILLGCMTVRTISATWLRYMCRSLDDIGKKLRPDNSGLAGLGRHRPLETWWVLQLIAPVFLCGCALGLHDWGRDLLERLIVPDPGASSPHEPLSVNVFL